MSLAMKVLCVLSILLGAALAQQLGSATNDEQRNKMALDSLSASAFNFTSDLYSELSKSPGNMIFSPLSIHSILTMTSLGARSHTAEQMRQALHLSDTTSATRAYKQVYHQFQSTEKKVAYGDFIVHALDIANKIYVKKSVTLNAEFLQESREVFQSETEVVDFTADAANKINAWVENKTNHKIKDLVSRDDFDELTAMVLVNAVYFKAEWNDKFHDDVTEHKPFHLADGSTRDVKMMEDRTTHGYMEAKDSHTQVLELPYNDSNMSMIVLLPSKDKGLTELEAEIKEKGLHSFVDNLSEVLLQVFLPKFRVEQTFALKDTLEKMGMREMFSDRADFSGVIADGKKVKVTKVVHKAFIDVDEDGTEAAAATGVQVQLESLFQFYGPLPPVVFNADRPFVFAIYHKTSKQVVFIGRYAVPENTRT